MIHASILRRLLPLSMFGLLKKLFGSDTRPEPQGDSLAVLARARDQSDEFISRLAQSDVWILSIGRNGTIPNANLTEDALRSHIERNAKELSEVTDTEGIVPFVLERGAAPILPFFSTLELAEHFVRSERWPTVTAFQTLRVHSGIVVSPVLADCQLVLNVNSESERQLTDRERESLIQQTANA